MDHIDEKDERVILQAFLQIILSRSFAEFTLMPKKNIESDDIVYQVMAYMARNFREDISLATTAKETGFSQCAISNVFSGTFHMISSY